MVGMQDKNTSLAWHLAESLKAYIYSPSRHLDHRTDLLGFIYETVSSMLEWVTLDTKTLATLQGIDSEIEELEANYETAMDDLPQAAEKRQAYRISQRKAMGKLLRIIRHHNLLSNSVMRDIYAGKWSEYKNKRSDDND